VPYELRYCDAKFESGNFLLRNVVVIIVIMSSSSTIYTGCQGLPAQALVCR